MRITFFTALLALFALATACSRPENLKEIDQSVASPIDNAVSDDGKYFYVLNSDFSQDFNSGSILVVDEDGKKVGAVKTPRLGRSIAVAGTDMIAVFDKSDDDSKYQIHLYDLSSDPTKPKLVRKWEEGDPGFEDIDCTNCAPLNIALRKGYNHFAVTLRTGILLLGTLGSPRSASELKLVRRYGLTRRAMYLDPQRELLLQFPTSIAGSTSNFDKDLLAEDKASYDDKTGKRVSKPNEIPDQLEDTKFQRRSSKSGRRWYQFAVYNIAAEREKGFPLLEIGSDKDEEAIEKEFRWTYFTLRDYPGSSGPPDTSAQITDPNTKHYRTNFWDARPDPISLDAFYLSHRGKLSKRNRYANSVIKVTITGNLAQTDPILPTAAVLRFERQYGFSGELDPKNHFPGDFEVGFINGRLTLVVNHFKDQVTFRGDSFYSIAAKVLDGPAWHREIQSTSSANSYYQLAFNERGRLLVCSFYGNALIPLEVDPGASMTVGWDNIERIR
jgi:hypothetical protein